MGQEKELWLIEVEARERKLSEREKELEEKKFSKMFAAAKISETDPAASKMLKEQEEEIRKELREVRDERLALEKKYDSARPKYSDSSVWSFSAVVSLGVLLPEVHYNKEISFWGGLQFVLAWVLATGLVYLGFVVVDAVLSKARSAERGRNLGFAVRTLVVCLVYAFVFYYIH